MTASDLKEFELLSGLGDEDREALFELLEERTLAKGRRLFSEGNEAEGMLLVATGRVKISSRRTGRSELVDAPIALGANSLVAVGQREATVIAESPCSILELPRTSWRRLSDDYPRTACRLAEAIIGELAGLVRQGLDDLAS